MTLRDERAEADQLISLVRRNNGPMGAVAFFTAAGRLIDGVEDDVRWALRLAMDAGELDIDNAWQVFIPTATS